MNEQDSNKETEKINKLTSSSAQISEINSQLKNIRLNKRKRNLEILTVFFLLVALIVFSLYFFIWRHIVKTEDSYVNGHIIQVTPQVSGTVAAVMVEETQQVEKGELLVLLDLADLKLSYENALEKLKEVVRQYNQSSASIAQANANINAKKTALEKTKSDYQRRLSLYQSKAISKEEISHALAAFKATQSELDVAKAQYNSAKAVLGKDNKLNTQPAVIKAIVEVKQNWLNLERAKIIAPVSGQIAKRNVQLGQRVSVGNPLMVIIPLSQIWVDANFKETQLSKLKIGQKVKMKSDLYGSNVVFTGEVEGFSAGTGSAFSLLPAQNATGNWIKVVQRVPVKIKLNSEKLKKYPLLIGLSMHTSIDTDQILPKDQEKKQEHDDVSQIQESTEIDYTPVEKVIQSILDAH